MSDFLGTSGNDSFTGTADNESISGGAGNDILVGQGGADTISGGPDNDQLTGGPGDDSLDGGDGFDLASYAGATGTGVNISLAVAGPQAVGGGQGTDVLANIEGVIGSNLADTLTGDANGNVFVPLGGNDVISGGGGADTVVFALLAGGATASLAIAGPQNVLNGEGFDTYVSIENLTGSDGGNDRLTGDGGANVLAGRRGFDTLEGGVGNDTLDGGDNFDFASYQSAGSGVSVNLGLTTAQDVGGGQGSDVLISIEGVIGSAFNDTLTASADEDDRNSLRGGAGDDRLIGRPTNINSEDVEPVFASYFSAAGGVTVNLSIAGPQAVGGGEGVDTLINITGLEGSNGFGDGLAGDALANILSGMGGNDTLLGFGGDDELFGGAGDDQIDGGAGVDSANYGGASAGVTVNLAIVGPQAIGGGFGSDSFVNVENLNGSSFADTLSGDGGQNSLYGAQGDDSLSGAGGNDVLEGAVGNDTLDGGAGNDIAAYGDAEGAVTVNLGIAGPQDVGGGEGVDTFISIEGIAGSEYNDVLIGNADANQLDGDDGDDTLTGAGGADRFLISEGHDVITDFVHGQDKFDLSEYGFDSFASLQPYLSQVNGNAVLSFFYEGEQNTVTFVGVPLAALTAADFIVRGGTPLESLGSDEDDFIPGSAGADTLLGSDGNDTISAFGGNDSVDGGEGNDNINGGPGANTLIGGAGDDSIGQGVGNDLLDGGAGNDVLNTSRANGVDTLNGGDGDDIISLNNFAIYSTGTPPPGVAPATFAGSVFDGGSGFDYLRVSSQVQMQGTISGFEGIILSPGGEYPVAGFPNLMLHFDAALLTLRSSQIAALPANLSFQGVGDVSIELDTTNVFNGSAYVFEAGSNVRLDVLGSDGNDSIVGTSQGDDLDGEEGNDTLTGGGGADTFEISDGHDIITDFTHGQDKFDLSDFGFDTFANLLPYLSEVNGNAVFTITYDGQVVTHTFQGVALATLDAGDFLFAGPEPVDDESTENADVLPGGSGNDTLSGAGGNDTLSGFGGDDSLIGDAGNDRVLGGDGADTLNGSAGADQLLGGDGNDLLLQQGSALGGESFDGGAGIDTLRVTSTETVPNQPANLNVAQLATSPMTSIERLEFGSSAGQILEIIVRPGTQGGGGFVDPATTVLVGGAGADILGITIQAPNVDYTLAAYTWENLGAGDRVLVSGLDGANGELFNYTFRAAVTHQGVQALRSGGGADRLFGGDSADDLFGGAGNDTLDGGDGNDTLGGGAGADRLALSGGQDRILDFTPGTDRFDLSDFGFDTFASVLPYLSQVGSDTVLSIVYDGVANTQTFVGVSLASLTAADFIVAGATPIDNDGSENADLLVGGSGADTLTGDGGNDTITAFGGADLIDGGAGVDRLVGGAGSDQFRLSAGPDFILDFQAGAGGDSLAYADFLQANSNWASGTDPFASGHLQLVQDGADTRFELDADGSAGPGGFNLAATLANTSVLALTAANLGGFAPGTVTGGAAADTVVYTPATFTSDGGTPPALDGGGGVDTLTVTIPTALAGSGTTIKPSADGKFLLLDLNGDGQTDLSVTNVEDIVINGQRVVISGDLGQTGLAPNTIHYGGTAGADLFDAGGLTSLESVRGKGGAGNDTLIGGNDDDVLEGGDGNDILRGRGGPDSLNGGAGTDSIEGGDGADTINGGAGADSLTGGIGNDCFVVDRTGGADRVMDFQVGDRIEFVGGRGTVTTTVRDLDGDLKADDLLVSVAGPQGSLLQVQVLNVSSLGANDWIFT